METIIRDYGYWAVFLGVLLEYLGLPIPGEAILLIAGALAFEGHLHLAPLPFLVLAASLCGDSLWFLLGRHRGMALLQRTGGSPEVLTHAGRAFQRFGGVTLFFGKFLVGVRWLLPPLAGTLQLSFPRFLGLNLAGVSLWASCFSTLGYLLHAQVTLALQVLQQSIWLLGLLTLLVIAGLILRGVWRGLKPRGASPT